MATDTGRLVLPRRYLAIAILPALVVIGGDLVLQWWGAPMASTIRVAPGQQLAHPEGVARLTFLAAFLLVIAAATAAFLCFATLLVRCQRQTMIAVVLTGLLVGGAGAWFFRYQSPYQMQEMVSQRLFCAAALEPAEWPQASRLDALQVTDRRECPAANFRKLRKVIDVERVFLTSAVPALVLSAIVCLALLPGLPRSEVALGQEGAIGPGAAPASPDRHLLKLQIARLNRVLYLSAALLVSGILLRSAFLHYPEFALGGEAAAYRAHAQALLLFYAANYSVLIASFYLPAAAILARKSREKLSEDEARAAQAEFLAPMQLAKAGLAIFAPLLTGLLGEVVKLS